MRPTLSTFRTLASIGAIIVFVAACSSSGASTAPSAAAPTTAASAAAGGGGEEYTVAVANGTVGAFLTGEDGKTLYVFTPDSKDKSTCVDKCATSWPPFVIDAGDTLKPGTGVNGTLATFARPDGTLQVAINGLPLYYFAADTKAGDTTGQGVGGKWFVATPDGVMPSPVPSAASR